MEFQLTFPTETRVGLKQEYDRAERILEYGSGGSTIYALENGKTVIAAESDKNWIDRLVRYHESQAHSGILIDCYCDIGPTIDWGQPENSAAAARFPFYPVNPWRKAQSNEVDVDLVLIDGRFRVACFVTSVAFARKPLRILFDDYLDRPRYHIVEQISEPADCYGRAALFEIFPDEIGKFNPLTFLDFFFDAH